MKRYLTAVAVACTAAALISFPAFAQTPEPAPAPTATPFQGFSGKGTLAAEAVFQGNTIKFGAEVALMNNRHRVRIDLLKLDFSGTDSNTSAMAAQFLPKGTITLVYDQSTSTTTIWSEQKHVYYQSKMKAMPKPKATPAPKATAAPGNAIDQLLHATKSATEYDSFNESIALVGHQAVNGHTSSLFHFTLQSQKHGAPKPNDVSGDLALADDLSGIPMRFWVNSKGEYEGSLKLDLLDASTTPPPASVFAVPKGYKRVANLLDVFGNMPAP